MLLRIALLAVLLSASALPLVAQTVDDLLRALRLEEVLEVMREEGLDYGGELASELFPDSGKARWQGVVGGIYERGVMVSRFEAAFEAEMADDPAALDATLAFFGSDRGRRIIALEIAARRALLDDAVEEAARARVEEMRTADDPRLGLISRFAEVNDLVEQNVAGALNANLAFYRGMAAGGAFDGALSEREMLADVWSQEAEVRREAQDWLFPFLALAYQPLSDDDLRAYVEFSETAPGQTLNVALFTGFDALFETISEELGRATAQMMSGQDL